MATGEDPTALEKTQQALAKGDPLATMGILAQALTNPLMDVDKLDRLMGMFERLDVTRRKTEYVQAMARLAAILPIVDRNGRVKYEGKDGKPGMDRTYGKYEDIDEAIRPLYSAEGFSLSWKTTEGANGKIRMYGACSHREGHTEEAFIDLPHDSSGGKNAIQAIGSSVLGYGRRMLTTMIFNVRIAGVDIDGEDPSPISVEKVAYLDGLLKETGTTVGAFKIISGVDSIAEIPERDYQRCKTALETKKRAGKR